MKTEKIIASFLLGIFVLGITPLVLAEESLFNEEVSLPDPGILPDSSFYGMKKAFESIGNAFTFREESKANRALKLSGKRLAEVEAMAIKEKPEFISPLMEEYEKNIDKANEIGALSENRETRERVSENVAMRTSKHLSVLDEVRERVPEQAKERIVFAQERSMRGNQEALRALARENSEKAANITMKIGESRAEKAREAAMNGNDNESARFSESYQRYSEFGEEISSIARQIGQNSSKIDELISNATQRHQRILEETRERVSENARESINNSIRQTERVQNISRQEIENRIPGTENLRQIQR